MSADDSIAIFCSTVYPESKRFQEFRVIWAQAIENVYHSDEYLFNYFKNAPVFDTYQSALLYANQLEQTKGPTETGLIIITHPENKTWDEIKLNKTYPRGNDDTHIQ